MHARQWGVDTRTRPPKRRATRGRAGLALRVVRERLDLRRREGVELLQERLRLDGGADRLSAALWIDAALRGE